MMRSFLKVTSDFVRPGGMGQRRWAEIMTRAHADMASHWHKYMLPKHFKPGASSRYGYRPRSNKYRKQKARLASTGRNMQGRGTVQEGGTVDLVFTGAMRRQLVENNTIRAYPTRATLVMFGPRYVTMRVYKSNQPDKASEVTAVTDDEADTLADVMDRSLHRQTRTPRTPQESFQ